MEKLTTKSDLEKIALGWEIKVSDSTDFARKKIPEDKTLMTPFRACDVLFADGIFDRTWISSVEDALVWVLRSNTFLSLSSKDGKLWSYVNVEESWAFAAGVLLLILNPPSWKSLSIPVRLFPPCFPAEKKGSSEKPTSRENILENLTYSVDYGWVRLIRVRFHQSKISVPLFSFWIQIISTFNKYAMFRNACQL